MNSFHWPNLEHRYILYEADPFYSRIPKYLRADVFERAVVIGEEAAENYLSINQNILSHYNENKISIIEIDSDYILAGVRYFSIYSSAKKEVTLFKRGLEKWSDANRISYPMTKELFLAHEFFHFLEYEKMGLTSKIIKIPSLSLFGFSLMRTGVKSLSEVGAESFSDYWLRRKYDL